MDFQKLFNEYDFSDAERDLAGKSKTAYTSEMNQSRVISELVLNKRIEKAAKDIISSNESLAKSNRNHLRWVRILTGALVFVGLVQIILQFI